MNNKFRKSKIKDTKIIYEMDTKYIDPQIKMEDVVDRVINRNIIVIENNEGLVMGYCEYEKKEDFVKINYLVAEPNFGSELLMTLEKSWKKKGIKHIFVTISLNESQEQIINISKLNFYIRNNFRAYEIIYENKGVTIIKMKKSIK